MQKVLVVDDDNILQDSVKQTLQYHNFLVDTKNNGQEALDAVVKQKYDLVVMDVNMPVMNGIEALIHIKKHDPSIIVIILTAYSNVSDAVKAVKEGAYNYIEKPISSENLVALIKRALKARTLVETSFFSAPTLSLGESSNDQFVGHSNEMLKVFDIISKLAKVSTPVLIRGESGTGKELVAKAIHYNGPGKDQKFVTINLAAIPDDLIESELFGHEKGSFTGASERKIGKFQYADGGTLFLDEIGDISKAMQVKLLRVLQESSFMPVGSNRSIKVDVRVIAASHKPFEEMIKEGTFREDLFYRLNILPVYLPPLRNRKTDIPFLTKYYIDYFNDLHGLEIKDLTEQSALLFQEYSWPGNIRELRNIVEHAFIIESSDYIHPDSLPRVILNSSSQLNSVSSGASNTSKSNSYLNHTNDDKNNADYNDDIDKNIININDIKGSILDEAGLNDNKKTYAEPTASSSHNTINNNTNTNTNTNEELTQDRLFKYSFTFAKLDQHANIIMNFQQAKLDFEKEFILKALSLNKGKINQTALICNIPKKTLLRKIEKHEINPKQFYNE